MKIFKLMAKEIASTSLHDSPAIIYQTVKAKRHLLIIGEDKQPVGVVSAGEFENKDFATLISFIKNKPRVSPDQDISKAYHMMKAEKMDCLPIYDKNEFLGLITLDSVVDRLFAIIAERQQLYQKVVHDLRNPVSNFMGLNRLLLETEQTEETTELLGLMDHSAKHVMEILNDLLFVEIDENKPLQKELTELNSFYRGCVTEQLGLCALKQIRIEANFCIEEYTKDIDRLQVKRAVQNVISNAVKFSYPGSAILVSTEIAGDKLNLSISDSGIGIPDHLKPDVFKRFSPVGRVGTGGEPSTGLGLCFSKQCVEQHYGKIEFESAEGVGTTFYIIL